MEFGYARLSTTHQDLQRQLVALAEHGIPPERTYQDKKTGATLARPGFDELLAHARPGDKIVATNLDRLGRNLRQCLNIVHDLREQGIGIQTLHDPIPIDTSGSSPMADVAVALLALFAHMERVFMLERVAHARAVAATNGKRPGRPRKLTEAQLATANAALDSGQGIEEVAASLGVSRATLYRHSPRTAAGPAASPPEPPGPAVEAEPPSEPRRPLRVHVPAGFIPAGVNGDKVRAVCACGWKTRARPDEQKAYATLDTQHGHMEPVCHLCGRDRQDKDLPYRYRYDHLEVLTDPDTGDQLLVCADDQKACRDASAQRQVHLDRAAADALGLPDARPNLRVIPAHGGSPGQGRDQSTSGNRPR